MTKLIHCKKGDFDIYIGRPSPWGNPWTNKESKIAEFKTNTVEESIENFRKWLSGEDFQDLLQERRKYILENLHTLKDKTLACWCPVNKCHGNVLIELVDGKQKPKNFGFEINNLIGENEND